jgi:uncharacterized protein YqjF (DUF2071 family)
VKPFIMTPAIDRIVPTREPRQWPVMRQNWRELLFVHWAVPAEELRALVPPQLDLDLFDGTAYVGVVPFTMNGVRPVGLPPVPGLSSFHETNVRTYVHYAGRDPGVWFFSLDAANRVAVALARGLFHLPYYSAQMFLEREAATRPDDRRPILYAGVRSRPDPRPASYLIRACPTGTAQAAQPGTLEHFLIERYILYALTGDRLYQGRVHHHPYPVQGANVLALDESLLAAAGIRRPDSAPLGHFAAGVDVIVYALQRIA